MIIGQIGSYMQLQGSIKYGWTDKYLWLILTSSVPICYVYIKSVQLYVEGFGGEIWPSRLIGFAIGIFVFTFMSSVLFKEHLSTKTLVCLGLAFSILVVQLFWK